VSCSAGDLWIRDAHLLGSRYLAQLLGKPLSNAQLLQQVPGMHSLHIA
jgi:hypothetical protein